MAPRQRLACHLQAVFQVLTTFAPRKRITTPQICYGVKGSGTAFARTSKIRLDVIMATAVESRGASAEKV
jgi:hypothetical protein